MLLFVSFYSWSFVAPRIQKSVHCIHQTQWMHLNQLLTIIPIEQWVMYVLEQWSGHVFCPHEVNTHITYRITDITESNGVPAVVYFIANRLLLARWHFVFHIKCNRNVVYPIDNIKFNVKVSRSEWWIKCLFDKVNFRFQANKWKKLK